MFLYFRFFTFVIPCKAFRSPGIQEYYSKSNPQQDRAQVSKYIFTFYVNLLIGIKIISWNSTAHRKKIFVFGCGTLTLKHIQPPLALSVYPASKLIICPEIQRKWQATGSLVLSLLTRNLQFVTSIVPAFDSSIISETISVF